LLNYLDYSAAVEEKDVEDSEYIKTFLPYVIPIFIFFIIFLAGWFNLKGSSFVFITMNAVVIIGREIRKKNIHYIKSGFLY